MSGANRDRRDAGDRVRAGQHRRAGRVRARAEGSGGAVRAACEQRGWELVLGAGGGEVGQPRRQPARARRCARVPFGRGEADAVVVAKLDRLSRSVVDAGRLLEEARKRGFNIVALDLGLDLSTPTGELVANVLAAVAQWERRMIGVRTSEALQVKIAGGLAVTVWRGAESRRGAAADLCGWPGGDVAAGDREPAQRRRRSRCRWELASRHRDPRAAPGGGVEARVAACRRADVRASLRPSPWSRGSVGVGPGGAYERTLRGGPRVEWLGAAPKRRGPRF